MSHGADSVKSIFYTLGGNLYRFRRYDGGIDSLLCRLQQPGFTANRHPQGQTTALA